MTIPGLMHLILVGIQAISAMAAIWLIGLWFKNIGLPGYFIYSIVSFVLLIITGIISMVGAAQESNFLGLLKRLNIFVIFQWLVVIGIWFFNLKFENNR